MHQNIKNFSKPPLQEVLCGLAFEPLAKFAIPHVGLLWQDYQPEYSLFQEVPPLEPMIERFEDEPAVPRSAYEAFDTLPMPRFWFFGEGRRSTVQVQQDRFMYSWKRTEKEEYPRFKTVYEQFSKKMHTFENFIVETQIGTLIFNQYELTYVNLISLPASEKEVVTIDGLLPQFKIGQSTSFLPKPSKLMVNLSYDLPNKLGRLHASVQPFNYQSQLNNDVKLIITVRGFPGDGSSEARKEWFSIAREWVVNGFVDLTSKEIQQNLWGIQE